MLEVYTKVLWTADEYNRMSEMGFLDPQGRFELIQGEVIRVSPQGKRHGILIAHLTRLLSKLYGEDYYVRVQLPLSLGRYSEPEPDFSLCEVRMTLDADRHPETAALVIEVADSSLSFDRDQKGPVYAEAKIPEFWVLNVADRSVEVMRRPHNGRYEEVSVRRDSESLIPGFASEGTTPHEIFSVL